MNDAHGRPLKAFAPPESIRPSVRSGSEPQYDDKAVIHRAHREPSIKSAPVDGHNIALKIHSRSDESGNVYVGLGPYGNLWDAKVSGDITVVTIDGRLADPDDEDDPGWISIDSGENLYLACETSDGDIDTAGLEVGSSSSLCEFSGYTQTVFRVPLARGEVVDSEVVAMPMHEGELVADFTIINSKLAKYAR